jgi:hypothetical protein
MHATRLVTLYLKILAIPVKEFKQSISLPFFVFASYDVSFLDPKYPQ